MLLGVILLNAGCEDDFVALEPRDAGTVSIDADTGPGEPDAAVAIDGGPRGLPLDGFCEEMERVYCEANLRCCTVADHRYATVSECVAARLPNCEPLFEGAAVRDGSVTYDGVAAEELMGDLRALAESCIRAGNPVYRSHATHVGTRGEGTDCAFGKGDFSRVLSCAPGLGCFQTAFVPDTRDCRPRVAIGASCEASPCEVGAFCNEDTVLCEAHRPNGAPCTSPADCVSSWCGPDSTCTTRMGDAAFCDELRDRR